MSEPLRLRHQGAAGVLVLIRLGALTLSDAKLAEQCADFPHWTVVLSQATSDQFARVRALFEGPLDNPAWDGTR